MLRLPRAVLSLKEARSYCRGASAKAFKTKTHLVLDFSADLEGEEVWLEDHEERSARSIRLPIFSAKMPAP